MSAGTPYGLFQSQFFFENHDESYAWKSHRSREGSSSPPYIESFSDRFSVTRSFDTCESNSSSGSADEPLTPRTPPFTSPQISTQSNRPRHVPIKITEDLVASVLQGLPQSPDPQELETSLSFVQNTPFEALKHSFKSFHIPILRPPRPRHIPILIPRFAQPHGPFPPTPADSGENTPRASASPIFNQPESQSKMSHPATGTSRPGTADSTASATSPPRLYNNSQSQNSFQIDLSNSQSSLNQSSLENSVANSQSLAAAQYNSSTSQNAVSAMAAATTSQPQNAPSTSLSGLVCNVHKCTGTPPRALVGATTTILGDKLYVFGGRRLSRRRPQLTADLYELDLLRRHWVKVETTGNIPPPRYFHSVCALGDTKLICYGGMSPASSQTPQMGNSSQPEQQPEVVVMSDIHIYDTKTRTWTHVPIAENPQGRYAHCATVLPSSAVFSSDRAPLSAIQNNPSSGNPNQGSIGVSLDGTGGAEMIVVGGQDSANTYIDQISVFNLRSLKWTVTTSFSRSCGAYRSVVAPLTGFPASRVGSGIPARDSQEDPRLARQGPGGSGAMLVYSNYNFMDVKLDLQIRLPDGSLVEKTMSGSLSPPGLRFPNGGVLDKHFVVSGTYLTSSKQEYALWALDLRTLTWSRIDTGGTTFTSGSWNRGILWNRRNTFVILGDRRRNLVEDYNHRRINFNNVCLVELEAFGLYDNPRLANPSSSYSSSSASNLPISLRPKFGTWTGGGRQHFSGAEELGQMAMGMKELSDMDIITISGERIPVNSHILARRWGPYFVHLLREGSNSVSVGDNGADTDTLRPPGAASITSRNSSITITPTINTAYTGTTITSLHPGPSSDNTNFHPPNSANLAATTRSRTLYLPHTPLTIHALLHYLYTSSLPPIQHKLGTPQILCSLLQIARPYRIDGLLEAVVERLHEVMDSRNAAAVFNASAMAAGGGRGTGFDRFGSVQLLDDSAADGNVETPATITDLSATRMNGGSHVPDSGIRTSGRLRAGSSSSSNDYNDHNRNGSRSRDTTDSEDDASSVDGSGSGASNADTAELGRALRSGEEEEIWSAERSCVIGLQKRGLRGLMEGRRMRERGRSVAQQG